MKHIFLLLSFISLTSFAQHSVSGTVYDESGKPIPYVNVVFKRSTIGTVTDENGKFYLESKKKYRRLEFSSMGYKTRVVRVRRKFRNNLSVTLKEDYDQLSEVVIIKKPTKRLKKKENPAYRILKEIWKRKKKNGLKQVDVYQYKKYETTEIGLNHIDTLFLQSLFKKEYKQVMKELPFDSEGFNYYVPIYIKEMVYDIYGNNQLNKERIDTEAEKTKGFYQQGFVFDRMSNKFDDVDIYSNTFNLFNKPFVSPISSAGFDTYDYLLYDSTYVDKKKIYNIYFFPRREEDLAFEGHLLVSDRNFAVTKISMKMKKDVNVNFVRGLSIEKEYSIINDSVYLPRTDAFEGDFTLLDKNKKNKGLNIKKTYRYSGYRFDKAFSSDFYDRKVEKYKPKQFKKNEEYWEDFSDDEQIKKTYVLIDRVKNKKRIKNLTKWLNILSTGYFNLGGPFQFGPIYKTIGKNGVEGLRCYAGMRTYKSPDDRFRMIGHVAYGLKDKKFKYGLQAKYLLSYQPRIEIGAKILNDNTQLARMFFDLNQIMYTETFGTNFVFTRGKNYFLSRIKEYSLKLDYQLSKNFHAGIIPSYKLIRSAAPKLFSMNYLDKNANFQSEVTDIGSDLYLAYTPGRHVYGYGVKQRYGKNPYPSFVINYHKGFEGLNNSVGYDKLQFRYHQSVLLGKIGKTDITLDLGKIFGKVPLALLSPVPANQVLLLKPATFTLLNYYDYVTDAYAVGHFEHHFNGFILNRLPLIRKLKWRTVTSFRLAYGSISDENKAINRSDVRYAAPTEKPYYEYSIGLENIGYGNIRFIRVDAVWRSDYTSVNGLASPKFAVRMAFRPDF